MKDMKLENFIEMFIKIESERARNSIKERMNKQKEQETKRKG